MLRFQNTKSSIHSLYRHKRNFYRNDLENVSKNNELSKTFWTERGLENEKNQD